MFHRLLLFSIKFILGVANGGVLVWSLLNWVGIVLEMVENSIKKHGQYKVLKGYLGFCNLASYHQTKVQLLHQVTWGCPMWLSGDSLGCWPLLIFWCLASVSITSSEVLRYVCIWSVLYPYLVRQSIQLCNCNLRRWLTVLLREFCWNPQELNYLCFLHSCTVGSRWPWSMKEDVRKPLRRRRRTCDWVFRAHSSQEEHVMCDV